MKRIALAIVLLAAGALPAAAQLDLPPDKWWENERLIARLGLTDDQQAEIAGLVYGHALRMVDLSAAVKRAEIEMAGLVGEGEFDPDGVRAAFARFQQARQALERERFEMLLAVRGVLTTQQWLDIQELQKEMRRWRWNSERRPPQGGGSSGGPRPHN